MRRHWIRTPASVVSPPALATSSSPRRTRRRRHTNAETVPGHLVLGLLQEPGGIAMHLLNTQGVTADSLRDAVTPTLPTAVESTSDLRPYDRGAKKVLELTFREALRLGHNYVGTEHILLALLEFEDGDGPLTSLGLTKSKAEADVVAMLEQFTANPL